MLVALGVLLLNLSAPVGDGEAWAPTEASLPDAGLPPASATDLADDGSVPLDPALPDQAEHAPDIDPPPGEPRPPVLDVTGLVRPDPDDLGVPLPCVRSMHAGVGFGACAGDLFEPRSPPKEAAEVPADAATPPVPEPALPRVDASLLPEGSAVPLSVRGKDGTPPPPPAPVAGEPTGTLAPAAAEVVLPHADDPMRLMGRAAVVIAPTLLLAKLLASLVVRSRKRTSPARDALLALVEGDPGIHHMELVRRSGLGNGTVQHHLRNLVEEGRLQRVATSGHTCFFPARSLDPAHVQLRTAVRSPVTRQVLQVLAEEPRSLSAVSEAVGLPVSTVHYHVGKLVRVGALAPGRVQGRRALAVTPLGQSVLGQP